MRIPCGPCHTSGHNAAQSVAIQVFDLKETRWPATLFDQQLHEALRRAARQHMEDDHLRDFVCVELELKARWRLSVRRPR